VCPLFLINHLGLPVNHFVRSRPEAVRTSEFSIAKSLYFNNKKITLDGEGVGTAVAIFPGEGNADVPKGLERRAIGLSYLLLFFRRLLK
jgi:hypothetical protein